MQKSNRDNGRNYCWNKKGYFYPVCEIVTVMTSGNFFKVNQVVKTSINEDADTADDQ
jgi:hypothetical protein